MRLRAERSVVGSMDRHVNATFALILNFRVIIKWKQSRVIEAFDAKLIHYSSSCDSWRELSKEIIKRGERRRKNVNEF